MLSRFILYLRSLWGSGDSVIINNVRMLPTNYNVSDFIIAYIDSGGALHYFKPLGWDANMCARVSGFANCHGVKTTLHHESREHFNHSLSGELAEIT